MKTLIRCKNFEQSSQIRDFIEESLDHSVGKFEAWRGFEAEITLKNLRGRSASHYPQFECELLIRGKKIGHPIFVKKESPNLFHAVHDCLKVCEKILRRSAKIRVSNRRHIKLMVPDSPSAA
jgi:ribosome-associated translation inhibitor RaiA